MTTDNHRPLPARMAHAVLAPGRRARFKTWRKTPQITTRGYLAFRDFILIGLVSGIVLSGVWAVRDLRAEDCRSANDRRIEIRDIALGALGYDRFFLEFIDSSIPGGLDPEFTDPLFAELDLRETAIDDAYELVNCPGPDTTQET